jgi:hypothetical protein
MVNLRRLHELTPFHLVLRKWRFGKAWASFVEKLGMMCLILRFPNHARPLNFHHPSSVSCFDQISSFLANGVCGRLRVNSGDQRDDTGVCNAETECAVHLQLIVDSATQLPRHHSGGTNAVAFGSHQPILVDEPIHSARTMYDNTRGRIPLVDVVEMLECLGCEKMLPDICWHANVYLLVDGVGSNAVVNDGVAKGVGGFDVQGTTGEGLDQNTPSPTPTGDKKFEPCVSPGLKTRKQDVFLLLVARDQLLWAVGR